MRIVDGRTHFRIGVTDVAGRRAQSPPLLGWDRGGFASRCQWHSEDRSRNCYTFRSIQCYVIGVAPDALTFRPQPHRSGALTIYTAATATHSIELYQCEQAEGARTDGSWFLTIGLDGAALRTRSRHHTMALARRFATDVLNALNGPTHDDLLAAFKLVASGRCHTQPAADEAGQTGQPIIVIACGAAKLGTSAPAQQLYTSPHFALMLRAARRIAEQQSGRVLILSALHGLVELDTQLAPYDVKIGEAGSIKTADLATQLATLAPSTITTLLPHAYAAALDAAAEIAGAPDIIDLFADAPGIGYQRAVASRT